jgi:phytoene dehydrogenase-like protein
MELTLPGFLHDFGSAVYPLGAGSPFFSTLPLHDYGLEWVRSLAPLAHPLDDGTAIVLEQNLEAATTRLGADGVIWRQLMGPLVKHWSEFAPEVLGPVLKIPRHPWLLARFGMNALLPARVLASRFKTDRTRALFAGLAGHSFLSMDEPLTSAFAMLMAAPAHVVGWPIACGGSQSITNALSGYLAKLGGRSSLHGR